MTISNYWVVYGLVCTSATGSTEHFEWIEKKTSKSERKNNLSFIMLKKNLTCFYNFVDNNKFFFFANKYRKK